MSGSCGWFPLRPDQIQEWVARHAHELPQTLTELSTFPIPFRKAIVAALPVNARVALWREHVAGFLAPEAGLSDAQREFVQEVIERLPEIFGSSREAGQKRAGELERLMRELLTREQAGRMFGILGPPEPPEGLPLPVDALAAP